MPPIFVIVLFDLLVMGPLTAWLAYERRRSAAPWFLLGALLGPLALFAVGLAPAYSEAGRPAMAVRRRRAHPDGDAGATVRASAATVAVPWSSLSAPAAATPEAAQLVRVIAALGAPSEVLFGRPGGPAPGATTALEARPSGRRRRSTVEVDEDRPLRLRQPRPGPARRSPQRPVAEARPQSRRSAAARPRPSSGRQTTPPSASAPPTDVKAPPIHLIPPWSDGADRRRESPTGHRRQRGQGRDPSAADSTSTGREPPAVERHLRAVPGTGPSAASAAATAPLRGPAASAEDATTSLCVAVFLGGMLELSIGERYLIEVSDETISLTEAVAITRRPLIIRIPVEGAALTEFDDRFVIGCQPSPGRLVQLAFRGAVTTQIRRRLMAAVQGALPEDTPAVGRRSGRSSSA